MLKNNEITLQLMPIDGEQQEQQFSIGDELSINDENNKPLIARGDIISINNRTYAVLALANNDDNFMPTTAHNLIEQTDMQSLIPLSNATQATMDLSHNSLLPNTYQQPPSNNILTELGIDHSEVHLAEDNQLIPTKTFLEQSPADLGDDFIHEDLTDFLQLEHQS